MRSAPRFSAYVADERDQEESADMAEAYGYWVQQFELLPPALDLPTDQPRPVNKTYRGATVRHRFSDRQAARKVLEGLG